MKRTCKQCGAQFTLSQDEISFYQSKNLHLPKRCEQCRRENKESGYKTEQKVRPYHSKNSSRVKQWMAAAVVFVLLVAGIGIFQTGRLFERDQTDTVNEVSAEITADSFPATDSFPVSATIPAAEPVSAYSFRKAEYLQEHFERHGAEFDYASADEYLAGAN